MDKVGPRSTHKGRKLQSYTAEAYNNTKAAKTFAVDQEEVSE